MTLTPPPAELTNTIIQNKENGVLLKIIQNEMAGTSMPAWKNDLSNQQILDALGFLRTFREYTHSKHPVINRA